VRTRRCAKRQWGTCEHPVILLRLDNPARAAKHAGGRAPTSEQARRIGPDLRVITGNARKRMGLRRFRKVEVEMAKIGTHRSRNRSDDRAIRWLRPAPATTHSFRVPSPTRKIRRSRSRPAVRLARNNPKSGSRLTPRAARGGVEARVARPPLGVHREYSSAKRHGACPARRGASHDGETREDAKSCGAENAGAEVWHPGLRSAKMTRGIGSSVAAKALFRFTRRELLTAAAKCVNCIFRHGDTGQSA
jgi:hypothetical protein